MVTKYIIMAGGNYEKWQTPRQLIKIKGEPIIARTIRLLRENGITDISISSNNPDFEAFAPVLYHNNDYYARQYNDMDGYWCDAFYPETEPVCYLFGDVVFSPEAIRTIISTETDDIMLFGSRWPFAPNYPKWYIEPFAFKVQNQTHLRQAIDDVKRMDKEGVFGRKPIAWELWSVIRGFNPNQICEDYVVINDYTCDIDNQNEIEAVSACVSE